MQSPGIKLGFGAAAKASPTILRAAPPIIMDGEFYGGVSNWSFPVPGQPVHIDGKLVCNYPSGVPTDTGVIFLTYDPYSSWSGKRFRVALTVASVFQATWELYIGNELLATYEHGNSGTFFYDTNVLSTDEKLRFYLKNGYNAQISIDNVSVTEI